MWLFKKPIVPDVCCSTPSYDDKNYSRDIKALWWITYHKMGIKADLSSVNVYQKQGCWPILIPHGLTEQMILSGFKKCFFGVSLIDVNDITSKRSASSGAYCIYVSDNSDSMTRSLFKDNSAKDLSRLHDTHEYNWNPYEVITLTEAIAFFAWHRTVFGKRFYRDGLSTLCSGSRLANGKVPFISDGLILNHIHEIGFENSFESLCPLFLQ